MLITMCVEIDTVSYAGASTAKTKGLLLAPSILLSIVIGGEGEGGVN